MLRAAFCLTVAKTTGTYIKKVMSIKCNNEYNVYKCHNSNIIRSNVIMNIMYISVIIVKYSVIIARSLENEISG